MNTITLCHHCHGCSNEENPWSSERAGNKIILKVRRFILVCIFGRTSMYQNILIGTNKRRKKKSSDILFYF